ncbi:MAG: MBL fold metallo-hydrolase [Caldisericia bacterium]|nr:MBL fold metallo-hydrolase [Caldisericia bacterium]
MIKISILCNDKAKEKFYSEHGFSALIEKDGYKLIFDTGTTDVFLKNILKFNKNINEINDIVISHGHYDHMGGLRELSKLDKNFSIWSKEGVFIPKFSEDKFAGIEKDKIKQNLNFRFIKEDLFEIMPHIYIFGPSPISNNFESIDKNFKIKSEKGLEKDYFTEEINLAIDNKDLILITGCAHRGIVNIVNHAVNIFNKKVNIILGGFHLYNASKEKLIKIVNYLNNFEINKLIPCHCTGDKSIKIFKELFKGEVMECLAGDFLIF